MKYLLLPVVLITLVFASELPIQSFTVDPIDLSYSVQKYDLGAVWADKPMLVEPSGDILTDESPPEEIIRAFCENYGYSYEKAFYLAHCESRLDPLAANGVSSAKGFYQFLDGTWETECEGNVLSAIHNSICAIRLLSEGKVNHWTADPKIPLCLKKFGIEL